MKSQIKQFLEKNCRGAENSITSSDLQIIIGCKGTEVRTCINELRQEGVPICSWRMGYYFADTEDDVRATIKQMQGRIKKMNQAINGLKEYAGELKTKNKKRTWEIVRCVSFIVKALKERTKMILRQDKFNKFAEEHGYTSPRRMMNDLGCSDREYRTIRATGYISCDWVSELYNRFGEEVITELLVFEEDYDW